jgi:hypothetical protein
MRRHKVFLAVSAAGAMALVVASIAFASTTIGATGATGVAGATDTTGPIGATGQSVLTEPQIKQLAVAFAAANGDPTPSSMEYVEGSRQQLVLALSRGTVSVPNTEDVFAVVMQGNFVANVSGPGAPPSGSVLTMVIDSTTGELVNFGIQKSVPPLAGLGTVQTIE